MSTGHDLDPARRVCTRCIYDDRVSAISFDDAGVCNYCRQLDDLVEQSGTGQRANNRNRGNQNSGKN